MTDDKAIEAALDMWFRGTRWQELSIPSQESLCINMRAALAAADKVRADEPDHEAAVRFMGDNFGDDELGSAQHQDLIRTLTLFHAEAFAAGLAKGEAQRAALVEALEAVELTPGGFINFKRSIPRTQYGALNLGSSGLVRSAIEGWFEERDAALALVRKGV